MYTVFIDTFTIQVGEVEFLLHSYPALYCTIRFLQNQRRDFSNVDLKTFFG